jgi:glycerol uptake facilitator-like aquaporin
VNGAVGRRLLAEFSGTGLLVAVVVGSGIAATRLTSDGAPTPGSPPSSAPAFIAAQIAGGTIGTLLAVTVYPIRSGRFRVEKPARLAG